MQSFLFISNTVKTLETMMEDICEKYKIHPTDIITLSVEKSIGIADVRNLQKSILFTPLKSPMKIAIIHHAETMTLDAQNAFLKTLEEPPPHTIILLLATTKEQFLPTIISRCSIVEKNTISTSSELEDNLVLLDSMQQLTIREALLYAQNYGKTKESTIFWLEKTILHVRERMIAENNKNLAHSIRILQKTYTTLKQTNVNPRLALEQLFLSLG